MIKITFTLQGDNFSKTDALEIIRHMNDCSGSANLFFNIKPHQMDYHWGYLDKGLAGIKNVWLAPRDYDWQEILLFYTDVLVSNSSTTMLEAMAVGKPVVCYTPEPRGNPDCEKLFVESKAVLVARKPHDVCKAIKELFG